MITAVRADLADHREQTIFFARAGMELLQPGKYNLTTAARTNGTSRTNGSSGGGGGGGGGGVPASSPENIIQDAADRRTASGPTRSPGKNKAAWE